MSVVQPSPFREDGWMPAALSYDGDVWGGARKLKAVMSCGSDQVAGSRSLASIT